VSSIVVLAGTDLTESGTHLTRTGGLLHAVTRFSRLVSILVAASVPLLVLGSARGQVEEAPAASAGDAGAFPDEAAPPAALPTASPVDVGAPAPAASSAAEVVLPGTMTGVVEAPSPPLDVETPSFARRGQIVVSGDSSIGLSTSTFSGSSATSASAFFAPSLAYFIARNVSVGLAVDASYFDSKGYGADGSLVETKTTSLSVGPTVGLNVPLGERFSWYPQLTVGFEWTSATEQIVEGASLSVAASPLGYPSTTELGPYVRFYAPFLLHAADHFFFGFGPGFFRDFASVSGGPNVGGQRTEVFTDFVIGGYWGGEPGPAGPSRSTAPPRCFGEAGQLVFANDLNVSVEWTSHVGVDSTSLTTLFGGSVEYFVVDHFAIGVSVGISSASVKGIDGTSGAPVSTSTTALTFAPLLAADVPIGRVFSLFPRLSLSIGHERYDETSGSSENSTTDDVVAVGLYIPLLVHPAPHVFVGFGPSGNHELSHAVSYPNDPLVPAVQNRETTWGAGLVVGGWL
jgi:hypothetical protein